MRQKMETYIVTRAVPGLSLTIQNIILLQQRKLLPRNPMLLNRLPNIQPHNLPDKNYRRAVLMPNLPQFLHLPVKYQVPSVTGPEVIQQLAHGAEVVAEFAVAVEVAGAVEAAG